MKLPELSEYRHRRALLRLRTQELAGHELPSDQFRCNMREKASNNPQRVQIQVKNSFLLLPFSVILFSNSNHFPND